MQNKNLSVRQLRAGELIRQALAEIFYKEKFINDVGKELIMTISEVRTSADLKNAKVYVIPFDDSNIDKFIEDLKRLSPYIRTLLNKKIKLKYSPELIFKFDDTYKQLEKIENIFSNL